MYLYLVERSARLVFKAVWTTDGPLSSLPPIYLPHLHIVVHEYACARYPTRRLDAPSDGLHPISGVNPIWRVPRSSGDRACACAVVSSIAGLHTYYGNSSSTCHRVALPICDLLAKSPRAPAKSAELAFRQGTTALGVLAAQGIPAAAPDRQLAVLRAPRFPAGQHCLLHAAFIHVQVCTE